MTGFSLDFIVKFLNTAKNIFIPSKQ